MPTQLTAEDVRQSLNDHVAAKGAEIFVKYGPHIGWKELQLILQDRGCVRYPCELVFDSSALLPGECTYPRPNGSQPEEGFTMFVHPLFMTQLGRVARLVLYQLVPVNYGEFASAGDAESFGAAALGLTPDQYYAELCELADELADCGCS